MNYSTSLFQNLRNLNFVSFRSLVKYIRPIKYFGFKYYPRHENFKDPPYTPSKLFLIKRIKPLKGRNAEEKKFLNQLSIDGKKVHDGHLNIVKNIPQINAMLWKVKHLIEIKPIHYKGELPKDGDFSGTHLRETGELIISPKLKISEEVLESSEKYINETKKLNKPYLKKYLLEKWNNGYSGDV